MRNIARTFWVSGLGAILSLGLVQGCGDDEDDGTGGRGGRGGSGGGAGTAGTGGKGGAGGQGGKAGAGGSAGAAGDSGADSGDGGRALTCDTYCDLITANCRSSDAGDGGNFAQYDNRGECMSTCNAATSGAAPAWRLGSYGVAGNTLGCRIYHADNAQSGAIPSVHCQHAGEIPTAICLDPDAGAGDAGDASHD